MTVVVPSLFHSSLPLTPSSAENSSVPPIPVRFCGEELVEADLMFLTNTVPFGVPSLFHSSLPFVDSWAAKNSVPLTFVRREGKECPGPGIISLTSTVPASEPSLSPNPPKDTDGRREESGRGVRELQGK